MAKATDRILWRKENTFRFHINDFDSDPQILHRVLYITSDTMPFENILLINKIKTATHISSRKHQLYTFFLRLSSYPLLLALFRQSISVALRSWRHRSKQTKTALKQTLLLDAVYLFDMALWNSHTESVEQILLLDVVRKNEAYSGKCHECICLKDVLIWNDNKSN